MAGSQGTLVVLAVFSLALAGCVGSLGAPPLEAQGPDKCAQRSHVAPGSCSVFGGSYDHGGPVSKVLTPGPYGILPGEKLYLASELDGQPMELTLWLPDVPAETKVPAIFLGSPYLEDTSVVDYDPQDPGLFHRDNFVPHGYAYAQYAIRGTGDSGGCDEFRGTKMRQDLSQVITWLGTQEWSNGNVAQIGKSYPGGTPYYSAGTGNPHLKTIVPLSGTMNAWEVYGRNGTPESRAGFIIPGYTASWALNPNRSPENKLSNVPCPETYQAWAWGGITGATGEREPAAFWDERNGKPAVEDNYEGSVFLVQGLEDWNVDPAVNLPWVDELARAGTPVKMLLGQWNHDYPDLGPADTNRWDWAEVLLHWYDFWLKGDTKSDTGPPVQVQDNALRWRDELAWPPRDAAWKTLHLGEDGSLADAPGAAGEVTIVRAQGTLPDAGLPVATQADFAWGPVAQETRIAGLPRVHVTVTPEGPGGYLGAFLYDRDPAGGELTRIGWTAMNLRFHEGGHDSKDVTPGEPIVARMEIQPMDAVLEPGHELVLRIWMTVPEDRIGPPPGTPVTLHWGGDVHSVLELPLIERGPKVFFQPPQP